MTKKTKVGLGGLFALPAFNAYHAETKAAEPIADIVARIGLYHLASETAFGNLFRFALNVDTLADSLVIIVLDWSRPWTFLKTLDEWLGVLEQQITKLTADKGWLLDELRERGLHFS